jgi:hypothetical protein
MVRSPVVLAGCNIVSSCSNYGHCRLYVMSNRILVLCCNNQTCYLFSFQYLMCFDVLVEMYGFYFMLGSVACFSVGLNWM